MPDNLSSSGGGSGTGRLILTASFGGLFSILAAVSGAWSPFLSALGAAGSAVFLLLCGARAAALIYPLSIFLISLLCTFSPVDALRSLTGFCAGGAVYLCVEKKQTKTFACVCSALVFFFCVSASLLPGLLREGEGLAGAARGVVSSFGDSLREGLGSFRDEIDAMLGEAAPVITDEDIRESVTLILSILPAAVIQMMLFLSYLTCSAAAFLLRRLSPSSLPGRPWGIVMSAVSSSVFLLSFLIYTFAALFSEGVTPALATSLNLVIILLPAFFIVGAKKVFSFFRADEWNGKKTIFVIFIFLASLIQPGYLLYLGALYGAAKTLADRLAEIKR